MIRRYWFVAIALAACSSNPAPQEPALVWEVTEPVVWTGDEDLAPLLVRPQLTSLELGAADRIEARIGAYEFRRRLGYAVEDTTAHWLVRVNALRLLTQRGATEEFLVYNGALQARDERIRIVAVSGMREMMTLQPKAATQLLTFALRDPSYRVQTAALQILADREVEVLREYLPRVRSEEVRGIMRDLIRVAEERGAPLHQKDSAGTLERTTANGKTLTFRPTTAYPQWDAAVGDLILTLPGQQPVVVASGVEAVGKVVPAFFTKEEATLVYEVNREVHARDIASGATRKLADGIAPRVQPFTDDVVYFSEDVARRIKTFNNYTMRYSVMRVPAAGGEPKSVGTLVTNVWNEMKGNYSPVRWSRILETEGNFTIVGDRMDPVVLPSPFGGE